jgi:fumarate reductase (CoM/CoB) subunit A
MNIRRYVTDVLVIGFGGAGLRAALEAARSGARVLLIGKGGFTEGGATGYGANEVAGFNVGDGIADPGDTPGEHYRDIMEAAQGAANPVLARILAEQAPAAYAELQSWGLRCLESNGVPVVIRGCFASRSRMHMIPDHGKPILSALRSQLGEHGYGTLERHVVTNLLVADGRCHGVLALDPRERPVLVTAGAVVLAAGGGGQLFVPNLYPMDITGDAYALAYRAGATLVNMEFMQAGLGVVVPGGRPRLLNSWMWRMRPGIVDERGRDLLGLRACDVDRCYADKSHFPFSAVDSARHIEITVKKAGRAERVFLDFTRAAGDEPADPQLRALWRTSVEWYVQHGVDIRDRPVEVTCVGHAVNGGVEIDAEGRTDLPGLFAAGECAGGPHGADRLGGNMLLACQVFGSIAGRSAARFAMDSAAPGAAAGAELPEVEPSGGAGFTCECIGHLRAKLQESVSADYLVVKDAASLERCEQTINSIEARLAEPEASAAGTGSLRALAELRSLLATARCMVASARFREESRGAHFREDYPDPRPGWGTAVTCRSPQVGCRPVLAMRSFADRERGGAT